MIASASAGTASSWVSLDSNGAPQSLGLSLDEGALIQLGSHATETTPPAHVYDVPHFDVHAYTIDEARPQTWFPPAFEPTVSPDR